MKRRRDWWWLMVPAYGIGCLALFLYAAYSETEEKRAGWQRVSENQWRQPVEGGWLYCGDPAGKTGSSVTTFVPETP